MSGCDGPRERAASHPDTVASPNDAISRGTDKDGALVVLLLLLLLLLLVCYECPPFQEHPLTVLIEL